MMLSVREKDDLPSHPRHCRNSHSWGLLHCIYFCMDESDTMVCM